MSPCWGELVLMCTQERDSVCQHKSEFAKTPQEAANSPAPFSTAATVLILNCVPEHHRLACLAPPPCPQRSLHGAPNLLPSCAPLAPTDTPSLLCAQAPLPASDGPDPISWSCSWGREQTVVISALIITWALFLPLAKYFIQYAPCV